MTPAAFDLYADCRLCPRACGKNRQHDQTGVCGETAICRLALAGVHFGEEPSFTGSRGSGTLFFSGCGCGCFFCQNYQISRHKLGTPASPADLLQAALGLIADGVHNLNFVTPDHFWPHVQQLCLQLRRRGVDIPFIYNCSGYARAELIADIAAVMDIFLPDFKFADQRLAKTCMGDERYPKIALAAIEAMVAARGFLSPWDPSGQQPAKKGVLVRHLVLPGEPDNSRKVLRSLYDRFGPRLPLAIMSQFRPTDECLRRRLFTQPLDLGQYRRICRLAEDLGFEQVYIQPEAGDDDFLPDFTSAQVFPGNHQQSDTDTPG